MRTTSRFVGTVLTVATLAAARAAAQEAATAGVQEQLDELREQNEELNLRLDALQGGELERMGLGTSYDEVAIDFKLFGNVDFGYDDPAESRSGTENSFQLGVLDLFFTAQIGDNFQVLSETKAEGSGAGASLDQERLWGSYRAGEVFNMKLGLEHSEISRWNRQYHHGAWLEPTIRRPFLARYEGDGGILPMHNAGLELGGDVHSDCGTLHYFAVLSNGRGANPGSKQKAEDVNDHKAVELGIAFAPEAVQGLRVGTALRFDEVDPVDTRPMVPVVGPSLEETLATLFVEYRSGPLESLAEFAFIQDDAGGGQTYSSRSAYVQLGYRFGDWTPYTRYDFKNMAEGNPFYMIGDRDLDAWQQTFGARYDFNPYTVLKFELSLGEAGQRVGGGIANNNTTFFGIQLSWAI